jgi:hypothetical protein
MVYSAHYSGNTFCYLKQANITMNMMGRHDDFLFLYLFLDAALALQTLRFDVRTLLTCFYFIYLLLYDFTSTNDMCLSAVYAFRTRFQGKQRYNK